MGIAGSGVMSVAGQYSSATITTATTTTVKSGAGILHTITVQLVATGTIIAYDNTAASGTVLIPTLTTVTAGIICMTFDLKFATGLTIVTGTAAQPMAVTYR